jgi:transcription initiation factor TFIIIB Brf1 subunit/transcription initiation factor TFIIB
VKKVKKDELIGVIMVAMSARHHRLPYMFKELSDACEKCSKKEICRGVKVYSRKFPKIVAFDRAHMNYGCVLPRLCSTLGFEWEEQRAASLALSRMLRKPGNSATNPLTLVAVALAKVKPDRVADISVVCGVSKHTILKCKA